MKSNIVLAGQGALQASAQVGLGNRLANIEHISRLRKEADARGEATVTVPTGLLGMVVHCALNGGYRAGEGRSRTPLSSTDKEIRQAAEDGAPELFAKLCREARESGERNPINRAREQTARTVQTKMIELGVKTPPSIASLMKRLRLRIPK